MEVPDYVVDTQKRRVQNGHKTRLYGSLLYWFFVLIVYLFERERFMGVFMIFVFTYLLLLLLLSIRIEVEKHKLEQLLHKRMKDL